MRSLLASLKYSLLSSNRRLFVRPSREITRARTIRSCETIEITTENKSMKRTRAATKIQQQHAIQENPDDEVVKLTKIQMISKVESNEKPKLNLKSLRSENNKDVHNTATSDITESSKKFKNVQKEAKTKAFIRKKEEEEELKPNTKVSKGKPRAVVDLQMMKEELKQLEDPPITPWEKELSSGRLQYEFFDIPCEELAQQLLGKVLVRYLENGTILKGRIVETEAYLGAIDKASQTYQNRVTPRNIPMYMSPGTIYVYMTYGMYHCFNISSQEANAYVLIRAVEPLVGLEYMELLRNMQLKDNGREKQIARRPARLKQYELCDNPFKICDAFTINQDVFDQKLVYACNNLWLENQPFVRSPTIVAVPLKDHDSNDIYVRKIRYYVLGSASVSERNSEREKHAYIAAN